jgi:hypothetical protein
MPEPHERFRQRLLARIEETTSEARALAEDDAAWTPDRRAESEERLADLARQLEAVLKGVDDDA